MKKGFEMARRRALAMGKVTNKRKYGTHSKLTRQNNSSHAKSNGRRK